MELRYGVMCSSTTLTRWQRRCIELLGDVDGVALAAVVVDARSQPSESATRRRWRMLRGEHGLWNLYNNVWVARRARGVQRIACDDLFEGVPRLDVHAEMRGRFSEHLPDDEVAMVEALDLDFLLRFGFGILRGSVLEAARYGIWSFHHDDERVIRGGPPSFWEVVRGDPTTGVLFQRLTDRLDGGIPLARSTFRTVHHSYPRNRDVALLGAADLPARVARGISTEGIAPDGLMPSSSDAPILRPPRNLTTARFLVVQAGRIATAQAKGVALTDRWTVGVLGHRDSPPIDASAMRPEWIPEVAPHGYLADPFPIVEGRERAILVEDYDYRTRRGLISALVESNGEWALHRDVIDPGVHASYPYVVRDGGEIYCIPETAKAGVTHAWRCADYPLRWERVGAVIEDVPLVDPTLFRNDERWWLLGGRLDDEPDAKLFAWWADSMFGPWHPHPLNPVVTDITAGRPGGTVFEHDGRLYRPAQDSSRGYGTALAVCEVTRLDTRVFQERVAHRIVPPRDRYRSGVHTLARDGDFWVIDAKRRLFDSDNSRAELTARTRRLLKRSPISTSRYA